MTIEQIEIGQEYFMPSIVHLPVKVTVLNIKNGWVEIEQGLTLPERLYLTEDECPQR